MNYFNFDLERMQKAVEGESIRIPNGMRGAELKAFLSNLQMDRKEALAKANRYLRRRIFREGV